jgi:hypothetical protein
MNKITKKETEAMRPKQEIRGFWIDQLQPLIDEFKDGEDEPLDGDDVDAMIKIIRAKINLHEGNITQKEYDKILG